MLTPETYFNIHGLYDLEKLKQHAEHNLVDVITSKEFPSLVMLHYADDAQWDKSWNPFNRMCRGLIVDLKNQRVIAYPFDKFFNVGEMPETSFDRLSSLGAFEVSEKLDGCFSGDTLVNLWDGGTLKIKDIVNKKLFPTLIGLDYNGNIIPTKVINHFANGVKTKWLSITIETGKNNLRTLIVTPNHSLHINGKWELAFHAVVGDLMTSYGYSPDEVATHFIESSLLGDGYLGYNTRGGVYYREGHNLTGYSEYIKEKLGECFRDFYNRISGFGSSMLDVNSKTYKTLIPLRKKWYPKGKKVVPKDLSWMDDFSVAKWYMDDGSLAHNEDQHDKACFSTNGFSRIDVARLGNRLKEMYGIDFTVYNSKGWNLRINYKDGSIHKLWKAIAPHIIPCMRYKLPKEYRDSSYFLQNIGKEIFIPTIAKIVKIENRSINTKKGIGGIKAYDIQTETGNYMCKSVLVHNSMLILFQEPETGDFRFTTKGSFDADHAAFANQFIPKSLMNPKLVEDYTFVFELISKQFQIVVDYKRKGYPEGAYLIGVRHRKSNRLLSYKEVQEMAKEYNIPTLKTFEFSSLESILANVKTLSVLDEGYVLLFEDGTRAKVKGTEYLRVHRFISQMSDKHLLESMPDFDTIEKEQEFLQMVPEEYRDDVKAKFVEFKTKKVFLTNEIYSKFSEAPKEIRKEFALWVQQNIDPSIRGFMFTLLDGKQLETSKLYNLIGEREKVSSETRI